MYSTIIPKLALNYWYRPTGGRHIGRPGEAGRNGRAAQCMYHERFPHRHTPSHILFVRIQQRLRETGTFILKRTDCGARRKRCTVDFQKKVLHHLEENLSTSTRMIADAMNVSQSTIITLVMHSKNRHLQVLKESSCYLQQFLSRCIESEISIYIECNKNVGLNTPSQLSK
ncbi:hypothetical protein C0J52_27311 [Blattella germanica]|nr:hypothetical protein C0J52_27311 [Blattella germanica]